jgi:hypothetical protein
MVEPEKRTARTKEIKKKEKERNDRPSFRFFQPIEV